jgi:hypothetical protein
MTAANQLKLLTDSLAPTRPASFDLGKLPAGIFNINSVELKGTQTVQNQVVDALNKLVINTFAIAQNTYLLTTNTGSGSNFSSLAVRGMLAEGGWVTGGTPGRDSVPIMAMPDEFMVNARATRALTDRFGDGVMDMINTGRVPTMIENNFSPPPSAPVTNVVNFPRGGGGNSNAELIAEVKSLKEEVKKLREENTKVTIGTSNQLARGVDKLREDISENVDKGARRIADQSRMNAQQAKQRGG